MTSKIFEVVKPFDSEVLGKHDSGTITITPVEMLALNTFINREVEALVTSGHLAFVQDKEGEQKDEE